MCGIVGLLVKKPALRERLGELMLPMLIGMTERGPDSAGMAVFGAAAPAGRRKLSLYSAAPGFDWKHLEGEASEAFADVSLAVKVNHAILESASDPQAIKPWLRQHFPVVQVLSVGRRIDLYKDVGLPAEVAQRYAFAQLAGTHLVGHTRMATESAVNVENAHPYTAGEDWCIVHNGSLSNPGSVRRQVEKLGIAFDGDCDTEAACRYLEWRMREGDSLEAAIEKGFSEFDGFYTFLMGTADKLALVRDPHACKPATVAETDEYVAIASEFRSLARLPDVKHAQIFEPAPERIYSWSVQ
ncbi:MAG: class II glutamine amidotransferase [Betaproteobacteria bacterium]|jgi:glutamate synthase domain-containing protein 1